MLNSLKTLARTIAQSFATWQNHSSSVSHALSHFALYRGNVRAILENPLKEEWNRKAVKLFGILEVAGELFKDSS
jgi:hypothetical protein